MTVIEELWGGMREGLEGNDGHCVYVWRCHTESFWKNCGGRGEIEGTNVQYMPVWNTTVLPFRTINIANKNAYYKQLNKPGISGLKPAQANTS
jgi:hypothetical protein